MSDAAHVVLDEKYRYCLLVEHADGAEYFLDHRRRKARRRLIEHDQLGLPHQAAPARVVIVNAEPTPFGDIADAVLREPIGKTLPLIL